MSSARCKAELCVNWTGQGCICAVLDIEPDTEEAVPKEREACERCDTPAVLVLDAEDADGPAVKVCAKHVADVALALLDAYGEHGVTCIYRANEV